MRPPSTALTVLLLAAHALGKRSIIWAGLLGVGMGLVALLIGTLGLVKFHEIELARVHDITISRMRDIAQDSNDVLNRLNRESTADCDAVNLKGMREMLFSSRFVRDIGLYNSRGELVCTTAGGVLPEPFKPLPGIPIKSPSGEHRTTWFDTPLQLGGGNYTATVIAQGSFNVVIDPYATDEVYRLGAHLFWVTLYGGEPSLVSTIRNPNPALMRILERAARTQETRRGFYPMQGAFIYSNGVQGSSVQIQTFASVGDMLRTHSGLAWSCLLAAILLGHLAFWAALPRFRQFASLDFRMHGLLKPENVICMFQPIMTLDTRQCTGCEVLMRLRDGDDVIYPDNALPTIMAKGLTWKLDKAVIARALQDLAAVLPLDAPIKVALNVFPQNVKFDALHSLIEARCKALNITGWTIDIEVIEQDYDPGVIEQVSLLKAAGYQVSVDDFGTGFSNLGSIKTLSPTYLKIDKSFVFDMEDASLRSNLIPEIVGIARAVGAQVVAEGVENAQQAERLQAFGVHFGQGYYFARPMPASDFAAFYASFKNPRAKSC
jgi:sensor c-di-GMP phosphodiesterase-like protein